MCYYSTNFYLKAIPDFKKAFELSPNHHDYAFMLGSSYLKKNDLENALDSLNKAVKLDPQNIKYLERRAEICEKMGKIQQATEDKSRVTMLKVTTNNK